MMINSTKRKRMGGTIQRNINIPRVRPATTFHKNEWDLEIHIKK